ncbi:MAG: hypothetical protein HC846_02575 [Blastocatellia bacterium]|nr:hypothetical protein [Blastocatellia bacterium]
MTLRFGYNTSDLTGIQVESQNQSLGQNDFSRTGITIIKDASFSMGLNSTLGGSMANEFRFTFGKRKTSFKSQMAKPLLTIFREQLSSDANFSRRLIGRKIVFNWLTI